MGFTNPFICFPNFYGLHECALFVQIIYGNCLDSCTLLDAADLIVVCTLLQISFPTVQDDLDVPPAKTATTQHRHDAMVGPTFRSLKQAA